MSVTTKEMTRQRKLKQALKSALIGALLALICRALPPEYQGPCETVLKICSGGL